MVITIYFFLAAYKIVFTDRGHTGDKSYIERVKSYPINIEIKTVKTYGRGAGAPEAAGKAGRSGTGEYNVELNSSLVLLPKIPMQPRYFDPRVGYFTVGYTDFDANPQGVNQYSLIKRWRLEPKEEDMEKYKRGELVEPKNPSFFILILQHPKNGYLT